MRHNAVQTVKIPCSRCFLSASEPLFIREHEHLWTARLIASHDHVRDLPSVSLDPTTLGLPPRRTTLSSSQNRPWSLRKTSFRQDRNHRGKLDASCAAAVVRVNVQHD